MTATRVHARLVGDATFVHDWNGFRIALPLPDFSPKPTLTPGVRYWVQTTISAQGIERRTVTQTNRAMRRRR